MIFTESAFLVFIAIVLPLYYATKLHLKTNNLILLVASYIFYGWANWWFVFLLFSSSAVDFFCAVRINRSASRAQARRWLALGIVFSLSLLGFFKYYVFFATSLATLLGDSFLVPTVTILLPVGISFYTFQSMSYLIDVYRGAMKRSHDLSTYLLYVAYFPQLVAGPIERAIHLLPQFFSPRKFDVALAADGVRQILAGYLMKIVVADNLAPFVDQVYGAPSSYLAPALLMATFFFGMQIYCDFAAYSNIAIGLAKLMGISIMQNFRTPYFSVSLPEFWRRWHISLSTFFRDYVYIPIGGNRRSYAITVRNLIVVFGISGLWHGANWTFLLWGLYHGIGLSIVILMTASGVRLRSPPVVSFIATQMFVLIGWVFFRSQSFSDVSLILSRIFDISSYTSQQNHLLLVHWSSAAILVTYLLIEYVMRKRAHILDFAQGPALWRGAAYFASLLAIVLLGSGAQTQFIYFQF